MGWLGEGIAIAIAIATGEEALPPAYYLLPPWWWRREAAHRFPLTIHV